MSSTEPVTYRHLVINALSCPRLERYEDEVTEVVDYVLTKLMHENGAGAHAAVPPSELEEVRLNIRNLLTRALRHKEAEVRVNGCAQLGEFCQVLRGHLAA